MENLSNLSNTQDDIPPITVFSISDDQMTILAEMLDIERRLEQNAAAECGHKTDFKYPSFSEFEKDYNRLKEICNQTGINSIYL